MILCPSPIFGRLASPEALKLISPCLFKRDTLFLFFDLSPPTSRNSSPPRVSSFHDSFLRALRGPLLKDRPNPVPRTLSPLGVFFPRHFSLAALLAYSGWVPVKRRGSLPLGNGAPRHFYLCLEFLPRTRNPPISFPNSLIQFFFSSFAFREIEDVMFCSRQLGEEHGLCPLVRDILPHHGRFPRKTLHWFLLPFVPPSPLTPFFLSCRISVRAPLFDRPFPGSSCQ